jgi:hypothetical protein
MIVGAAHVDGGYWINTPGTGSFIGDGVEQIKALGMGAVKLFLSRNYATANYPLEPDWGGTATDLTTLAQLAPFADVLADATLKHYILNVFGFANQGENNLWTQGFRAYPSILAQEYDEIKALAEHLLTAYDGEAKTFVLKNWEGDWAYQAGFALDGTQFNTHHMRRVDWMAEFFRTRGQAIADARRAVPHSDCKVLHAFETSRVMEGLSMPNAPRLLRHVLPRLRGAIDLVSHSAYDTILNLTPTFGTGGWEASQVALEAYISANLPPALDALATTGGAPVMLGEWGYPELEAPVGYDVGELVEHVHGLCLSGGVAYSIYWQVWDNEARGFYLYDSNGDLSTAGLALQSILA